MKTPYLIEDLLAKFEAAGVAATYEPPRYIPTPSGQMPYIPRNESPPPRRLTDFNELFGREIATHGMLRLDKTRRVNIYLFADEATAQECAALIEPGSNRLVRTVNGETKVVKLHFYDWIPSWWQEGPLLLYSINPESTAQLIPVLGIPLREPPTGAVALRVNNSSDTTWQNVTFAWDGESLVYGQLVPGMGGYRALPPKRPVELTLDAHGKTLSTEIRPLLAGSNRAELTVQNDTLFARLFRDIEFAVATDLIGVTWTWERAEYADGSTYIPSTLPKFAPHLRFGGAERHKGSMLGNSFQGNMGCNIMWGYCFVNQEKEILFTHISRTNKGGTSDAIESETRGFAFLHAAYRYEKPRDELHLITLAGDRMILSSN